MSVSVNGFKVLEYFFSHFYGLILLEIFKLKLECESPCT